MNIRKSLLYALVFAMFLMPAALLAQISDVTNQLKTEKISGEDNASGAEIGYVDVDTYLNVREGPSTCNEAIGRLHTNDKVTIVGSQNGWYKINYSGGTAWVCARYVSKSPKTPVGTQEYDKPKTAYVNVDTCLNVRTGPTTNYSIVGHLKNNEKVEILATSNGWHKIKYSGGTAWVCGKYISSGQNSNQPKPSSSNSSSNNSSNTQGDDPPPSTNPGILKVPIRSQFDSANVVNGVDYRYSWCGPTSFAMVMDYYGVHKSTYECAKLVEYTFKERNGTYLQGIVNGGKKAGFAGTKSYSGQSLNWLKSQVAAGKPVIVNVDTKWQGHYIVVVGFNGDDVVVNDPGKGDKSRVRYTMSRESFWQCWSSKDRRCVVVQK